MLFSAVGTGAKDPTCVNSPSKTCTAESREAP